jgi:hypothetical protein
MVIRQSLCCLCAVAALLAFTSVAAAVATRSKPPLRFRAADGGSFKIVQFADLHFGEGESTQWGPEQDLNSTRVMRTVLQAEAPVDLVVFSGDQLTGNNIAFNATAYWAAALLSTGAAVEVDHDPC